MTDNETVMTEAQREALTNLCERYGVAFREDDYRPAWDLPDGYVSGWIGGDEARKLYVGCDPDGRISS